MYFINIHASQLESFSYARDVGQTKHAFNVDPNLDDVIAVAKDCYEIYGVMYFAEKLYGHRFWRILDRLFYDTNVSPARYYFYLLRRLTSQESETFDRIIEVMTT